MGSVFGKETVAEPHFDVLLERNTATTYEVRKYGERFAATCTYEANASGDSMDSPFRILAQYIGVFGTPQNEGGQSISMTAPVATSGTLIDMTAPVTTENTVGGQKVMKFMLPAEYDSLDKIPKPTNPAVTIEDIPPQTGAVHRFNGAFDDEHNREMALKLGRQLMQDGVQNITEAAVLESYQSFGYNPPWTLPFFRRNEVWIELSDDQVGYLTTHYTMLSATLKGSSSVVQYDHYKLAMGVGVLMLGCYAMFKSRRQYSRL